MELFNSKEVRERMDELAKKILNEEGLILYRKYIEANQFSSAYQFLLSVLDTQVLKGLIGDEDAVKLYDLLPFTTEAVDVIRSDYISIENNKTIH